MGRRELRPSQVLIWGGLALALVGPLVAAALSPLLAWRGPVYIVAGFAGVIALALLLVQPLLIAGLLPGLPPHRARRVHRLVGIALVVAVAVHVGALWFTSPPDVIDALLFVSPTPFSDWGVVAMWAIVVTAALVVLRRHLGLRPRSWRALHMLLALGIVLTTVVHTVLIEGTMETYSKVALCTLVVGATLKAVADLGGLSRRSRRG